MHEETRKLLKPFLDEQGRLKQLPAKRKKKFPALLFLASKFQEGQPYTEKEVNEILNQWHSFRDPATLRRELYDHHLLDRSPDCKQYRLSPEQPTLEDLEQNYSI